MSIRGIVLLISICFLNQASAQEVSKASLSGVWRIQSIQTNGIELFHSQLGNPKLEFNLEGGYLINVSGEVEKGKYSVHKNSVVLNALVPVKKKVVLEIDSISPTNMTYRTESKDIISTVKLLKIAPAFQPSSPIFSFCEPP